MYKDTLEIVPPIPPLSLHPAGPPKTAKALDRLLVGAENTLGELPPLPELIAGAIELCEGTRQRVLLPLSGMPAEFALQREGEEVVIDCYGTESIPEVWIRGRRVALSALKGACAAAADEAAASADSPTMARVQAQLAERMRGVRVAPAKASPREVRCTGGSLQSPGRKAPLAFGFAAVIRPSPMARTGSRDFADVHALLFSGELWGFSGESPVTLVRGPILLAAQRMAAAMRLLLEAWQADRDMHARLRSGGFSVGVRLARGVASVELTSEEGRKIVLRKLSVPEAALPVLRLCSDMVRKLVSVDRSQMRNLRVVSLRHELRTLRRIVRNRQRQDGFENRDPDRLRMAGGLKPPTPESPRTRPMPVRLRYTERWSAEVEGLDAGAVYLCGDRLVLGTPKLMLALCRKTGEVLWSQANDRAQTLLVGRVLLSVSGDGELRMTDVREGHVYARTHLSGRLNGSASALFGGGGDLPPTAIVSDGNRTLWCVDLRTGELRFRHRARGGSGIQLHRSGRVLVVTSGDGSVDALDIATGEVVWRHCAEERFCLPATVVDHTVIALSGEPGGGAGKAFGIDLFTGRRLWQRELPAAPSMAPIATTHAAIVPCGGSRTAQLLALSPRDGTEIFTCHDPGIDNGGKAIEVDGLLIVNTPRGRVLGMDLQNGETRWSQSLSNPLTDDVPRGLLPLLRQGGLFVPSAQVHILRPSDGAPLTASMPCDLIPDYLQVDECGHLFVAEESGHLRAYAPAPHLTLVT